MDTYCWFAYYEQHKYVYKINPHFLIFKTLRQQNTVRQACNGHTNCGFAYNKLYL